MRTELRTGRWLIVVPGVYRAAGTPGGWHTRVWSALLAAGDGAVLGGRAAGWVYRIDGVPGYDRLHVVVPSNRRPRRTTGAHIERSPLGRRDIGRRGGIPILTPERTVVDLARTERRHIAVSIVSDALRTGAVSERLVREQLDAAHGRTGIEAARAAVAQADPRLESILEEELLVLTGHAGLIVVPQFEVIVNGRFIARLDFAVPKIRLGIEADGYATHAMRAGFERDHERRALLHVAGWTTLSFTAMQIRERPDWTVGVMAQLATKLAAAASSSVKSVTPTVAQAQ